jgi:hypothetical protein
VSLMNAKPTRQRLAVIAGIGLLSISLGLSGCSSQTAGAAAVVGDQRISESELDTEVQDTLDLQGLSSMDSSNELIVSTLNQLITGILVNELSDREKITVAQGEIDDLRLQYVAQAGGQEAFEASIGEQGISPGEVDSIISVNLQVAKLGDILSPSGDADAKSAEVFIAISELSSELGTEVAPRFGTWDPENLSVGPSANSLSEPQSVDLGSE